jgi:hypothetical protein
MSEMDNFNEETKPDGVTLTLNVQEINIVLGALAELPHRVSDGLIRKVFTQAQGQQAQ